MAHFALIESHIRCGQVSWGGTSDCNINKILQKTALRALYGLDPRNSCKNRVQSGYGQSLKVLIVTAL